MTDTYKKQLQKAGVNLDKALNRFMGNEAMYDKFLFSFTQEKSFGKLEESLNNERNRCKPGNPISSGPAIPHDGAIKKRKHGRNRRTMGTVEKQIQ